MQQKFWYVTKYAYLCTLLFLTKITIMHTTQHNTTQHNTTHKAIPLLNGYPLLI